MKKWHSPSTLSGLWWVNKLPGHITILVHLVFSSCIMRCSAAERPTFPKIRWGQKSQARSYACLSRLAVVILEFGLDGHECYSFAGLDSDSNSAILKSSSKSLHCLFQRRVYQLSAYLAMMAFWSNQIMCRLQDKINNFRRCYVWSATV